MDYSILGPKMPGIVCPELGRVPEELDTSFNIWVPQVSMLDS